MPLLRLIFFCVAGLLVSPTPALAGVLNDIQTTYQSATGGWLQNASGLAAAIFVSLVTIETIWGLIEAWLHERSLDGFLASLTKRLIWVGIATTLIINAQNWVPLFPTSFANIGAAIAGSQVVQTPSDVIAQADTIDHVISSAPQPKGWMDGLKFWAASGLAALGNDISFSLVAGMLLLTNIELYVIAYAGVFLLGFIGSRWTMPWAERYFGMLVAVCVQVAVLNLLVGLGTKFAGLWADFLASALQGDPTGYDGFFKLAASEILYPIVAWNAPRFVLLLAGGTPALGISGIVGGAMHYGGQAAANSAALAGSAVKGIIDYASRSSSAVEAAAAAAKGTAPATPPTSPTP